MTKVTNALAALGLFAIPGQAWAEDGDAARQPVSISVSTDKATLATPEGLQSLRTRVTRAIVEACAPDVNLLKAPLSPDWRCRAEMQRDAANKLAALNRAGGMSAAVK